MKGEEIWKVSKYEYISRYYWNKEWKDERRRVYGKYLRMNISLGTTGLKDERMKGWKDERMKGGHIWKVAKYEYISKYYGIKGWKDERKKGSKEKIIWKL